MTIFRHLTAQYILWSILEGNNLNKSSHLFYFFSLYFYETITCFRLATNHFEDIIQLNIFKQS